MDIQINGNGLNREQAFLQEDLFEREQLLEGTLALDEADLREDLLMARELRREIDEDLLLERTMERPLSVSRGQRELSRQLLLEDERGSLLSRLPLRKTLREEPLRERELRRELREQLLQNRELRRELQNDILRERSLRMPRIAGELPHAKEVMHRPATYVLDEDTEIIVNLELAGVEEKSISIKLRGDILHVKGEKRNTLDVDEIVCLSGNCWSGKFSRSVPIDFKPDAKQITAKLKNGILQIHVKKPQEILKNQGAIKVIR